MAAKDFLAQYSRSLYQYPSAANTYPFTKQMDIHKHCREDAHLDDSCRCYAGIMRFAYLFAHDVVKELQIQRMR